MTTKSELYRLISQLPKSALPEAERLLRNLRAGEDADLPRFLAAAPWDDEPETEEERAAVAEAYEDLRNGDTVPMEEIKREFGL